MRSRGSFLQYGFSLLLSLAIAAAGWIPARSVGALDAASPALEQFDLLDPSSGWVLIGGSLFWTSDTGQTWTEIGPAVPDGASVEDVEFIDHDTGWMLWSRTASDGSASFELAHTVSRGAEWTVRPLSLFEAGEAASFAEDAEMGWLDRQNGWIAIEQATGSNFSVGTLFTTSDGGLTWSRRALPVADAVHFDTPELGWAVGGPTRDRVFRTKDAGASWQALQPDAPSEEAEVTVSMPSYADGQGLLIVTALGPDPALQMYALDDASRAWAPLERVALDLRSDVLALSILDPQNFVALLPGTRTLVRMRQGSLDLIENQDGQSASIVALDMITTESGWARAVDAQCSIAASPGRRGSSVACDSRAHLLSTRDGGRTWQPVDLPRAAPERGAASTARALSTEILPGAGNTQILVGQGFDKCEIPTLSQLQAWAGNSPYQAVNLYIGGSSRACDNPALTASYLRNAHQQGWSFIPTWVGPQAPCTGYISRMSSDPATAFSQGIAQANLAVDRLAELGLTYPDRTGSIVYYDIEHYGTDSGCRTAVNAFMNGWVSELHALGNLAGVYGSTLCNTGLSDFLTLSNVPDAIWAARWYHNLGLGYYDPEASVWNLGSCIPNSAWSSYQRIRQYEGDHDESWGNLPLRIDSNVLDGIVAVPHGFFVTSIVRADASPTSAASVRFTVSFPEPVSGVDVGDFKLVTAGLSGAEITDLTGAGSMYTATVDTGSGNGTVRLDLIDDDSIRTASNEPLGGAGNGNGNYTQGKPYTIVKDAAFADVPSSHWAWSYIERLYAAEITGGCSLSPPGYCPDAIVSRAQMAVFLLRARHGPSYEPPPVGAGTGFGDVPPEHWAAPWIKQLAVEGITAGCGNGNYCPEGPVNRAQMAVFLLRSRSGAAYEPPPVGGGTGFGDVPPEHWAATWIKQLVAEGITVGCGNGNYCPEAPVNRAQMAVFLTRTFRLP